MHRSASRVLLLAGLVAASAACSDRNPAPLPETPAVEVPPPVHAALRCSMDVRARKLACAPAGPETAPGVSPLIVGGQGTNVLLTSTGTSYDSTTQVLRSDVTVQNLMPQALGTTDGAFPAPDGVRVFFHSGPVVTEGTGEVTVANADGEATFTSGAQPYFQYAGLLTTGSTTAPREWRFEVPKTVAFFAFTVFVAAPVAGPSAPPAGLVLLAGAGIADTVDAEPGTKLRIGVRGPNGKPAANTTVQLSGVVAPVGPFSFEVQSAPAGEGAFGYTASGVTNAQGIIEFRVKLGTRVGPARLVVSAFGLGLQDTARYTILPGRAAEVRSLPEDTTVLIGGRAPLRAEAFDRYGNARSDAVTISVATGPATVQGSEVVAGSSIGRIAAVATADGASDTSYVRVVPNGTIAAVATATHTGEAAALYMLSLDGSDVRRLRTSVVGTGYFGEMAVGGWLSPTKLVYHDNNWDHTKQLYVLNLLTGGDSRFLPEADRMEMENFPRASRDGSWVYFSGGTFWGYTLFRARADGTGKEALSFSPGGSSHEWGADLAPDGERIVFVREGNYYAGKLTIGELATREARPLDLEGLYPRWSPDGTRIAFIATSDPYSGTPSVVNADGTGARALSTTQLRGDISWSPDGKYIVGATLTVNHLAIIEVATGAEVIVPLGGIEGSLKSPVWKP
ncbi:MAG TPA: hypothetical protein VFR81_10580 [Longimicrobium sp.]|nr:hypothetical protein [Longimicrobium sp.]